MLSLISLEKTDLPAAFFIRYGSSHPEAADSGTERSGAFETPSKSISCAYTLTFEFGYLFASTQARQ